MFKGEGNGVTKTTEEVGLMFGDGHPLDDDDLTPDIVATALRRTVRDPVVVDRATRDIVNLIREYQMYRLDEMRL